MYCKKKNLSGTSFNADFVRELVSCVSTEEVVGRKEISPGILLT